MSANHPSCIELTKRLRAATLLLVIPSLMPQLARAQDASPEELADVVVTGTRIVRDGFEAPTPLTVIGTDAIQSAGTQNIADFLNTIPAFSGSITPATTQAGVSGGTSGLNALNLRSLGANRTLVLLDGQRSVGINTTGLVDVNLIPQSLVSRVDVVTGGASAAYGSDALAGVVNFVLDKNFTGIKGEVSGGLTDYGDNGSWSGSFTAGTPFAGGRGHFLFNVAAQSIDGIQHGDSQRDWERKGWQRMTNPAYGTGPGQSTSVPQLLLLDRVSPNNGFAGGSVITSGPLKGLAFTDSTGTPWQYVSGPITFDPDTYNSPFFEATQVRGTSADGSLTSWSRTQNAFLRASYDITDNVNGYVQVAWAHDHNWNDCCSRESNANITILSGNPFIPAVVQAQMTQLGLTSLLMGSQHPDLPNQIADNNRRVNRYVVGLNGKADLWGSPWSWNAYYQLGDAQQTASAFGTPKRTNFANALDAVRGPNGAIICRITLTNPAEGCVPYNLFGRGVNSEAAVLYVEGGGDVSFRTEDFQQQVIAVSAQGEPFSSWAGPVSLALGVEHRREDVTGYNDADSRNFNWFVGNYQVFDAGYHVTEGFVETVVPLAKDQPWARALDFNAAVRATDYSTSGYVTTWKAGLIYSPIDDVRFRVTRSRDIRAPNLNDLFNAGGGSSPGIRNPFRNQQSETIVGNTVGNPDLKPEVADTTGVGVVLQPSFMPGFSASVDYWNLDIDQAIGSISVQQILDQCYAGNQQFCDAVAFNPDGSQRVSSIRIQPFNLVTQIARGIDIEASYRLPLAQVIPALAGDFGLRALATHYLKNYSSNGINPPTDTAGQNTGDGPPNWRWTATASYTLDPVKVMFTARGVSAGTYNNTYIVCSTDCPVSTTIAQTITNNRIAGQIFFDAAFSYTFGARGGHTDVETFLNVRNLLNADPAPVAANAGGFAYSNDIANPALYDVLGRMYRLGFRVRL